MHTDEWASAFALNRVGVPVILAGRAIRVPDTDPDELRSAHAPAGIVATLEPVTATIEERMLVLARGERRHSVDPFRMSAQDALAAIPAAHGQLVSADRNTPLRPYPDDA